MSDYIPRLAAQGDVGALTAFCCRSSRRDLGTVIWASANIISFLQPILIRWPVL